MSDEGHKVLEDPETGLTFEYMLTKYGYHVVFGDYYFDDNNEMEVDEYIDRSNYVLKHFDKE